MKTARCGFYFTSYQFSSVLLSLCMLSKAQIPLRRRLSLRGYYRRHAGNVAA